jgi:hypothetical protein
MIKTDPIVYHPRIKKQCFNKGWYSVGPIFIITDKITGSSGPFNGVFQQTSIRITNQFYSMSHAFAFLLVINNSNLKKNWGKILV